MTAPTWSVTYEKWDNAAIDAGETDNRGFVVENVDLRTAVEEVGGEKSCDEADSWPIRGDVRWFTHFDYNTDFRTGEVEHRSLHIPDHITPASRLRLARLLGLSAQIRNEQDAARLRKRAAQVAALAKQS